ncbi:MAG: CRISPR-associated exonuclease Cas4, partial [Chthoniobacter sp.]|nr:CRISPR-associated exonuclease Cas4 [Chthoniobacter sp.]
MRGRGNARCFMETALQDQPARDRFIRELDTNFSVAAGAGVGKTTAIVERVAQLALRNPTALSRLVVVTYTKAAAEELRVRARARVLEQLSASAHLRQNLLAESRRAFFGTIHSFCLKLVREHGRFLSLPQTIDLLEDEDEPELWARFCESAALDALRLEPELMRSVLRFLSFEELLAIARKIDAETADEIIASHRSVPPPRVTFARSLAAPGTHSPKYTQENQTKLRAWLEEFESGADFLKFPDYATGSAAFKEAFAAELDELTDWIGNAAARLAAEIALGFRDFRRAEHRMTYADQIAWARRLIADERVLERLRSREFIVVLDEAQDTDAGMFSILTEITRPFGARVGEWPQNSAASGPAPGRFCFVGDEQQAIYASRADLGTYREYLDAFAAGSGGEPLEFAVTMRCPRRVIGAVNAIFPGRLLQSHLRFRELLPKPQAADGATWLLPIEPTPDETQIDALFA